MSKSLDLDLSLDRHEVHQGVISFKSTRSCFAYLTLHALLDDDCMLHLGTKQNIKHRALTISSMPSASLSFELAVYYIRGCFAANDRVVGMVVDIGGEADRDRGEMRKSIDVGTQTDDLQTGKFGERLLAYKSGCLHLVSSDSLRVLYIKLTDYKQCEQWQRAVQLALWIHASKQKAQGLSNLSLQALDMSLISVQATLKKIQSDRDKERDGYEKQIAELEDKMRRMYSIEEMHDICDGYETEIKLLSVGELKEARDDGAVRL